MTKNNFDALIVYSGGLANSANSPSDKKTPFTKGSLNEAYNIVYGYFLKTSGIKNLKCAFTTSSDIVGAGKCSSYWLFKKNNWIKVKKVCYSKLIFDKFSPVNNKIKISRNLIFSSKEVKAFNSPYVFSLFFDKYETYKKLKRFCIPAVSINGDTKKNINDSLKKLSKLIKNYPNKKDFADEVVMKDRFGAGGRSVFKFKRNNLNGMEGITKNSIKKFILQPLVKFNKGFNYQNSFAPTDIRLIFSGGKIVQTYIRIAKKGDFRCNEHKGGTLIYISKNDIPKEITKLSKEIAGSLGNNNSLFSLDFIVSNNKNIYLLEGNTGPGLDWNMSKKTNEIEAKKLIRLVIGELVKRSGKKTNTKKESVTTPFPISPTPIEPTFI